MTKIVKLSLAAAVAVAGLTTSASAQKLTDAIQGVDFSGSVEYRMEHRQLDDASTNGENAKIVLKVGTSVNDSVRFNALAVVNGQAQSQGDDTGFTQGSPNINVAKFTYTNGALAVVAGMQELKTPWTDAGDGARANGVLATYNLGAATLAATHYRDSQQGIDASNGNPIARDADLNALAVIGKAGPVAYQAWYMDVNNHDSVGAKATALTLDATFGIVALNFSHATLKGDSGTLDKQKLTKLVATVDAGPVAVVLGAAKGGSDGDLVLTDADAKVGFQSWNIRAGQNVNVNGVSTSTESLKAYTAAVVAPVGPVSLKVQYTTAKPFTSSDAKIKETLVQVSYKMSKNFSTYLRLADVAYNADAEAVGFADFKRARLSLKYTF